MGESTRSVDESPSVAVDKWPRSAARRVTLAIAECRRPGSVVRVESDPHAAGFYRRLGARETGAVPAPMDGDAARALPLFEIDTPAH